MPISNMLQVQTTNTFEKYTDDIVCEYDTRKHIEYDEYDANKVHGLNYVQFMQKTLLTMMSSYSYAQDVDELLDSITYINVTDWSIPYSMWLLFHHCKYLQTIDGLETWDISKCTDISGMFYECSFLEHICISTWDTSHVTNMQSLFEACYSLTVLDLHNWDTSNVTNMESLFNECEELISLSISNWNTSNVTDMSYMFANCKALTTLDLHNLDTSNVVNMSYMFAGCESLRTLDISNFKIKPGTNISHIFDECSPHVNIICNDEDTKTLLQSKLSHCRMCKCTT